MIYTQQLEPVGCCLLMYSVMRACPGVRNPFKTSTASYILNRWKTLRIQGIICTEEAKKSLSDGDRGSRGRYDSVMDYSP